MGNQQICLFLYLLIMSIFIYFFYTEKELRGIIWLGMFFLTGVFIKII